MWKMPGAEGVICSDCGKNRRVITPQGGRVICTDCMRSRNKKADYDDE